MNKIDCPQCLGQGTYMEGKSTGRGFVYKDCTLCNKTGKVEKQLADDFIFAQNEDNFEDELL